MSVRTVEPTSLYNNTLSGGGETGYSVTIQLSLGFHYCNCFTIQWILYNVYCTVKTILNTVQWTLYWTMYIEDYKEHCKVFTVQCTVYSVQWIVYTVHCTLFNVQYTLYTVRCILYTVKCTVYSEQCTQYTVHCSMYTIHCTLYTVHCTVYREDCSLQRGCNTGDCTGITRYQQADMARWQDGNTGTGRGIDNMGGRLPDNISWFLNSLIGDIFRLFDSSGLVIGS